MLRRSLEESPKLGLRGAETGGVETATMVRTLCTAALAGGIHCRASAVRPGELEVYIYGPPKSQKWME